MSRSVLLQLDPHDGVNTISVRVAAARRVGLDGLDWPVPNTEGDSCAIAPSALEAEQNRAHPPGEPPVVVVSIRCTDADQDATHDRVAAAIAVTRRMGAGVLRLSLPPLQVAAGGSGFTSYQDALNLSYQVLHSLRFEAAAQNVAIALDVPQCGYLLSPIETRELIDTANAWNVGVCVDLDRVARIGSPVDWIRTLGRSMRWPCR